MPRKTTRPRSNQKGLGSPKPTTMRFHPDLLKRVDRMAAGAKYQRTRTWLVAAYIEAGLARDERSAAPKTGVLS